MVIREWERLMAVQSWRHSTSSRGEGSLAVTPTAGICLTSLGTKPTCRYRCYRLGLTKMRCHEKDSNKYTIRGPAGSEAEGEGDLGVPVVQEGQGVPAKGRREVGGEGRASCPRWWVMGCLGRGCWGGRRRETGSH